MKVGLNTKALRQTTWNEYAIRFLVGGMVTAAAGPIAKAFGPGIGGLFLAFPAILPASATLIEKHEEQRGHQQRRENRARGREAAGLDAAGAAIGSIGLGAFALVVWWLIPAYKAKLILTGATAIWLVVSLLIWRLIRHRYPFNQNPSGRR